MLICQKTRILLFGKKQKHEEKITRQKHEDNNNIMSQRMRITSWEGTQR